MSQPVLPRVERAVTRALHDGRIPGAVVLVARGGAVVHRDARGTDEGGHPLRTDTVLWLASLTKPVCAVALLTLADEGRLAVDDPVSAYLPEFAEPGRVRDAAGRQLLSAQSLREMTANQTGDRCPGLNGRPGAKGIGFGLAVTVVTDPAAAGLPLTAGAFGWDGVTTRRFWVDPAGWTLFMYVPDQEVQQDIEAAVADEAG